MESLNRELKQYKTLKHDYNLSLNELEEYRHKYDEYKLKYEILNDNYKNINKDLDRRNKDIKLLENE